MMRKLLIYLTLTLLFASIASAGLVPLAEQQLVLPWDTTAISGVPAIVEDGSGGFWMATGGIKTYLTKLDSTGSIVQGPILINQTQTANRDIRLDISNGKIAVTWGKYESGYQDIYARIYDTSGNALTQPFLVNTQTTGNQLHPQVAAQTNQLMIVWQEQEIATNPDIKARIFDYSGTPLGGEITITSEPTHKDMVPDIAAMPNSEYLVVWQTLNSGNAYGGLYARRLQSDGSTIRQFRVEPSENTFGAQPRIAADSTGSYKVSYRLGSSPAFVSQLFNSADKRVGYPHLLNTDDASMSKFVVGIASDSAGNAATLWSAYDIIDENDLFVTPQDAQGAALSESALVNTHTEGRQYQGDIAMDDTGLVMVAFRDAYRDGTQSKYNVSIRRFQYGPAVCGNSIIEGSEQCDDGNTLNGDGCSSQCSYESTLPQFSVLGDEFTAHVFTDDLQYRAQALMGDNGVGLAVWSSRNQVPDPTATNRPDVFARLLHLGAAGTDDILVNTITEGSQYGGNMGTMAKIGSGYVVAFAQQTPEKGNVLDIGLQLFDGNGNKIGSTIIANQALNITTGNPVVSSDSNGNFAVAYTARVNNYWRVYARRFDSAGNPLGNEFVVSQADANYNSVDLEMAADGQFVVTYGTYVSGVGAQVFARYYDASGAPKGNEVVVAAASSPKIAMDAQGNWLLVYTGSDLDSLGVKGRYFDINGNALSEEFTANQQEFGYQGNPQVAMDAAGNALIIFGELSGNNQNETIYMQAFDASRRPTGDAVAVSATESGRKFSPVISLNNNGQAMVLWRDLQRADIRGRFLSNTPITVPQCQNNIVDFPEECDDGNAVDGDGCTAQCVLEGGVSADQDADGILDTVDNCPADFNPDQRDSDNQAGGDVCDVCPSDPTDSCDPNAAAGEYITSNGGILQTADGAVNLLIPAGATSGSSIAVTPADVVDPNEIVSLNIGKGNNLAAYRFEPAGIQFDQPVLLSVAYDDSSLSGKREDKLSIYIYDNATGKFEKQPTICDTVANVCTATITHFSVYSLIAPLDSDVDGVFDEFDGEIDQCPGSVLDKVELEWGDADLNPNQYGQNAGVPGDFGSFEVGPGNDQSIVYDIRTTQGCTCAQILASKNLENGQLKKGCSPGTMQEFTGVDHQPDREAGIGMKGNSITGAVVAVESDGIKDPVSVVGILAILGVFLIAFLERR